MIYYIYRKQGYKSLLPLNEECIFENVLLVVVKMKSDIKKVVNFPKILLSTRVGPPYGRKVRKKNILYEFTLLL